MKKILIKLSGKLVDPEIFQEMMADLKELQPTGVVVALVHGGGKTITHYLNALQIKANFVEGLRETNADAIKIVEMVLAGLINKQLTRWLNAASLPAIGISGSDLNLIEASVKNPALGFVGNVQKINPELIYTLWERQLISVIAPTGTAPDQSCLNINADTTAGALAAALAVDSLIFFSDTDGVFEDGARIELLNEAKLQELLRQGVARDGMIPKLLACQNAKARGVAQIKIAAWRGRGTLVSLLTTPGQGTEII